ncbi:unnamed protein product, partial [marine sediment metagenome]
YLYGLISLYTALLAKKKGEKGAFINNLVNSLILIISITINLITINFLHVSNIDFIIFPFDIFMIIFIIFFLPLFYYSIYREKRIVKRDLKEKPWKEDFSLFSDVLPFKYELYRKLTHLLVLLCINTNTIKRNGAGRIL